MYSARQTCALSVSELMDCDLCDANDATATKEQVCIHMCISRCEHNVIYILYPLPNYRQYATKPIILTTLRPKTIPDWPNCAPSAHYAAPVTYGGPDPRESAGIRQNPSKIRQNPSRIRQNPLESVQNPSESVRIRPESVQNLSRIHPESVQNPSRIRPESVQNPSESVQNLSESVQNPFRIHSESV